MTREEVKQAVEVLKAFADGKKIEISGKYKDNWNLIESTRDNIHFDFDYYDYRVAKEPQYRPFESAEECWNEMLKHQPFGWVRLKTTLDMYDISVVDSEDDGIYIEPTEDIIGFGEMIKWYTFADGEPFGVKLK